MLLLLFMSVYAAAADVVINAAFDDAAPAIAVPAHADAVCVKCC